MLHTQALKFSYPNGQTAFSFPDINCEKGSHWLILGQSGCGKTTLLHLIGGLLRPNSGQVKIAGQDIVPMNENQLDKFRGQNIGIIFQQSHLIKALNVEENLLAAQYLAGTKQDKKRVHEVLERLNLGHKIKSKTQQLSQGEQQRVSICRALVNNPGLILADEPTSSLDDHNAREVVNLLLEQSQATGATLVIVTHDSRLKELFHHKVEL